MDMTATQIYGKTIRQMPPAERLRLATLILEDLTEEAQSEQTLEANSEQQRFSARQILKSRAGKSGIFKTPAEADEYLKTERESWDR